MYSYATLGCVMMKRDCNREVLIKLGPQDQIMHITKYVIIQNDIYE